MAVLLLFWRMHCRRMMWSLCQLLLDETFWLLLILVFLGLWVQLVLARVQYVFHPSQVPLAYISHSSLRLLLASTLVWVILWSRARERSRVSDCPSQKWPTAMSFLLIPQDLMTRACLILMSFKWWCLIGWDPCMSSKSRMNCFWHFFLQMYERGILERCSLLPPDIR